MKKLLTFPGMGSYRGRYLLLSVLALLLIFAFAYSNWHRIYTSSQLTSQHIVERKNNLTSLNAIIHQFQLIKVLIYKYSLDPESVKPIKISQAITRLLQITEQLDISVFDDLNAEMLNNFIVQIPTQFHYKSIELIEIRSNLDNWIPVTKIIREELLPKREQINEQFNRILSDPEIFHSNNTPLIQEFLQLNKGWLLITSESRLLLANRLGIFDSSEQDINSRIQNISFQIDQLRERLASVKSMLSENQLKSEKYQQFYALENSIKEWIRLQEVTAIKILQSDWRMDLSALQELEQLLNEFNSAIVALSNELSTQSDRDIEALKQINQSLSFFFIVVGFLVFLFAIVGYIFVDRNILLPIAKTTRAMLLQARGLSQELDINAKTSETRDLLEAFNSMSEQIKQREKRLDFMAHHDALTNLPNRLMFNERLEHAITLTQRNDKQVVLLLLDLDRFKLINDTLGHLFGDKLLVEAASRLKECIRLEDTIARLGGDEFAIILENVTGASDVESIAKKITKLFERPFNINNQEIHTSTSIGIAQAPLNTSDATTLIRYSDIALYQSKSLGGNQFSIFSDELVNSEESIINFENNLREAINNQQFALHYQPQIDTENANFFACEALIRWNHPERGLLYPNEFISILDNSDLFFDLSFWVIRHAEQFQSRIYNIHKTRPRMSINLPSFIFQQRHYRERITSILLEEISEPSSFVLEITEDTLITDMNNTSITLEYLHKQGFNIALDDFGTGQSSLSHLRAFPIDIIKIDGEFIRNIHADEYDSNLVSAIISLGHDLNLQVVAEGVEKQSQKNHLLEKGCHILQGNLFSPPLTAADYLKFLDQKNEGK